MIDVHVHLRDGALSDKETIGHGLRVGFACGITGFFDMPNTVPPLTTREAIEARLDYGTQVARQIDPSVFYGVYAGVTADLDQVATMVDLYRSSRHLVGLKLFAGHSTGNMGLVQADVQRAVYHRLAECGYDGVLAVHCEKEQLMRPELWDAEDPSSHGKARPPEAEFASVAEQMTFARESGFAGNLHVCHISTAGAIELVKDARATGMRITCGATAHHALLDDTVAGRKGNLLKMNPPLRSERDRQAVFEGLCDGSVDWLESDHAPHTLQDKASGASGIPGFAGNMLLIRALRQAGVTERHLARICGERACAVFGIELPVTVPSTERLSAALDGARNAYPWDPFDSIRD